MSTSVNHTSKAYPGLTSLSFLSKKNPPRRSSDNYSARYNGRTFQDTQLVSTSHSDRVAIYDQATGSYCAYSLIESVNQMGLTRQEAEEWVQGLRLINQNMSLDKTLHVGFMIVASWAITAYTIWSLVKVLF